jgi:hypothetical protein
VINALVAGKTTTGYDNHVSPGLPRDRVRGLLTQGHRSRLLPHPDSNQKPLD